MGERYHRHDDGTVWPVDAADGHEYSVGWKLRYAPQHLTSEDLMLAASILDAYAHMTSSGITMTVADSMLRKARKARAAVLDRGELP